MAQIYLLKIYFPGIFIHIIICSTICCHTLLIDHSLLCTHVLSTHKEHNTLSFIDIIVTIAQFLKGKAQFLIFYISPNIDLRAGYTVDTQAENQDRMSISRAERSVKLNSVGLGPVWPINVFVFWKDILSIFLRAWIKIWANSPKCRSSQLIHWMRNL